MCNSEVSLTGDGMSSWRRSLRCDYPASHAVYYDLHMLCMPANIDIHMEMPVYLSCEVHTMLTADMNHLHLRARATRRIMTHLTHTANIGKTQHGLQPGRRYSENKRHYRGMWHPRTCCMCLDTFACLVLRIPWSIAGVFTTVS
jgi:hypothetical protein